MAIKQVLAGDGPGGQGRAGATASRTLQAWHGERWAEQKGLALPRPAVHIPRPAPTPGLRTPIRQIFISPSQKEGQLSSVQERVFRDRTWHLVITQSTGGPRSSCGSWCPHIHSPHHPQPGINRPDPWPSWHTLCSSLPNVPCPGLSAHVFQKACYAKEKIQKRGEDSA